MSPIQSKTVVRHKLSQPGQLRASAKVPKATEKLIAEARKKIINILKGTDKRKLAIVGPCSVDETDAVHEFVTRIEPIAEQVKEKVYVVVRAPVAKPRTTVGWRGLEQDSVEKAREQLAKIAARMPTAIELLEPHHLAWYGDILSMGWIGARSIEVQNLRLMASSAPKLPVLVKNRGDGAIKPAVQARMAIGSEHHQVPLIDNEGVLALHDTPGNKNSAVILRGGEGNMSNITAEAVEEVTKLNELNKVENTGVVIDVSHGNGAAETKTKSAAGQKKAFERSLKLLDSYENEIKGIMIEAYINEGNGLGYGLSRTDPCVDIESCIEMIEQLAGKVKNNG